FTIESDMLLRMGNGKLKDYHLKQKFNMRKIFFILFFIVTGTAVAQFNIKNPTAISLNGGFYLPYSSETYQTGVNFGFDIQHKIDRIYMFFDLTYNFSSRKNNVQSEYYNNTSSTGLLEISLGTRLYVAETNIKYFVDCGLGLYLENKGSYEIRINGVSKSYPSESNGSLGGNIGIGGDYPLTKDIDFVARVKYHLYFGVGDAPFLNTYFGIMGGIKYNIKF
ncbi:MAG: hypothetical protein NTU73_16115, partial [Ignavibacteriae bacterium]|nr:hypothetical protein [Ignavibacteriota bacterium]